MKNKDITGLIQRLEAFEDRAGVRLEAESAHEEDFGEDDCYITVLGELHSTTGNSIANDIEIQITLYNSEGRVIGAECDIAYADEFFGFYTFSITCESSTGRVVKIRLIPRRSL